MGLRNTSMARFSASSSIGGDDRKFTTVREYGTPPDTGGNISMEGIALYHALGRLPEPQLTHEFC